MPLRLNHPLLKKLLCLLSNLTGVHYPRALRTVRVADFASSAPKPCLASAIQTLTGCWWVKRQARMKIAWASLLLDNMLRAVGLARGQNVYIANVIKCRPPGNRDPQPDEVAQCEPYLRRQIALIRPKLILALGRFAAQSLLKTQASLSSLRTRIHRYEDVPVIVTYHPAYLLRNLADKSKAWADLCLAQRTYRDISEMR